MAAVHSKMKCALFYGPKDIRIETHPVPEPGVSDILVEIKACGICGTDVSRYQGKIGYSAHIIGNTAGHEITGIIKKMGQNVRGHRIGERVVIAPLQVCGECYYCIRGDTNLCLNAPCIGEELDGGYAQYVLASQKQVFTLPDNIDFDEGTLLADPVATPLHAVRKKADIKPGDKVAVWGTGPQGYCAIQLTKLSGGYVIAVGRRETKLKLARVLGADITINCEEEDVCRKVKEITDFGVDVSLECGGYPAALEQAIACTRKGGRIVMVGLQKAQQCDLENMLWHEKQLIASFSSTYQEAVIGIRLAENGNLKLRPLITHSFNLLEIQKAFELLSSRKDIVIKVVIIP